MTTTKTLADSGADFSTVNLAASWVQSNIVTSGTLTDDIILNTTKAGYNAAAAQTWGGWANGSHSNTMGVNPGDGFKDNVNVQTNALDYNESNGAFQNYGTVATGDALTITSPCTIQNLQIHTKPPASYNVGILSSVALTLSGNILYLEQQAFPTGCVRMSTTSAPLTINNCLLKGTRDGSFYRPINFYGYTTNVMNDCTFTSSVSVTGWIFQSDNGIATVSVKGCVMLNVTAGAFAPTALSVTGSFSASTGNAWGNGTWTNSTLNITGANEVQNMATDLREKTTAPTLKGGGIAISGILTDIVGTPRPATPDIGCWQLPAAASALDASAICLFVS